MFGAFNVGKVMAMRSRAASASHRVVSKAEFIRLLVATGKSRREAELQAKISVQLGDTECLVGNELLSIKRRKPRKSS